MARRKKYKHVIIVDEDNKPMVWVESQKQLCYCTDERWQDEHTPVQYYTEKKAKQLIARTQNNRRKWRMTEGVYKTMPFILTDSQINDGRKLLARKRFTS